MIQDVKSLFLLVLFSCFYILEVTLYVLYFQNVDQLIFNVKDLYGQRKALEIRQRYSELQRIEAYGFRKFQVNDDKLTFRSGGGNMESYKLNYLKVSSGRL